MTPHPATPRETAAASRARQRQVLATIAELGATVAQAAAQTVLKHNVPGPPVATPGTRPGADPAQLFIRIAALTHRAVALEHRIAAQQAEVRRAASIRTPAGRKATPALLPSRKLPPPPRLVTQGLEGREHGPLPSSALRY